MNAAAHYPTLRSGREHFKDLLDAAESGRPATVTRDSRRSAVVDADRFVHFLTHARASHARLVSENDGWSIFLPGLPIAADGADLDEALDEMVLALRDYAEAWDDHLRLAPNHAENWGLVQIAQLADDDQLKAWLVGE